MERGRTRIVRIFADFFEQSDYTALPIPSRKIGEWVAEISKSRFHGVTMCA
jgi:hypothetical protein